MQRSSIWLAFFSSLLIGFFAPQSADAAGVELRFSPSEVFWEPVDDGVRPHLPAGTPAAIPGSPDLPVVVKTVRPPAGKRLAGVRIVSQTWEHLPTPGAIATFLPTHLDRINPESAQVLKQLVTQTRGGYQRGERLDGLVIAPIQERESGWFVCTRLNLELTFEDDEGLPAALKPRSDSNWRGALHLDSEFDFQPQPVRKAGEIESSLFRPRQDGGAVDFVIVTPEAFVEALQPLKDWRMESGSYTVIKTVESIYAEYPEGVDGAEKIRLFLRDAYTGWGISDALLAGDTSTIPARFARSNFFTGDVIPTDMYYQCLDGNWNGNGNNLYGEGSRTAFFIDDETDLFPEIFIGRLPVNTAAEASVVVNKILTYETAPPVDADYPASALLLAEVLFPQNWAGEPSILFDGADLAETTAVIVDNGDFEITKLYENYLPFTGALPETLPAVIEQINRGHGVIHHVGHGFHNNIAVGLGGNSLTIPIVDGLSNGNRASFLYAINCTSSAIDFDSIGEHFLRNPTGGTFSSVGSTRFDFPGTSAAYDKLFYRLIFE
ncbi:MAG: hypothetical protein HKN21_10215, partial [Candidatus Eisenbacteria bacterium]|nr:hypothetical protein [Candidatus Eisenbacteria bacterium]